MEDKPVITNEVVHIFDIRTAVTVEEIKNNIKTAVLEGNVDAARVGVMLKRMAKISEDVLKDKAVKEVIETETVKYLKEGGEFFGAKVIEAIIYTSYDFSECNHPVLDELYKIKEVVSNHIKVIEEELKLLVPSARIESTSIGIKPTPTKTIVVDYMPKLVQEESGEVVEVIPPKKYQKEGIKYMKL